MSRHWMLRDYVCGQCESRLVEMCDSGGVWRVVCSRDVSHEGRIRSSTVSIRKAQSALEGLEIRAAFPDLVEQRQSAAQDLADLGL